MLFKIGEFSKISGFSVKTLRYYDEIDLFKPIEVDLFTGYRYYKEEQLKDLNFINMLKNIGFSLEEIKNNWNNFSEELFLNKKMELLKQIEIKKESIKQIDELRSKLKDGKLEEKEKQIIMKKTLFQGKVII